jgi:uncharacterized protein (TIGR03382 family)
MRTFRLALLGSLLAPAVANATPNIQGWMVADSDGSRPADVMQVLPSTGPSFALGHQILYLNHTGTTLTPSDTNDSRTGASTLVSQTTAIPAWSTSASNWAAVLSCEQAMWAPFNVTVTDVDPGSTPHLEAIFTTYSSVIGMDPNVGGVSPYTIGCDVIPNSIVFTFAQAFGGDAETVCEVMAQEMAHSYGIDHELLASDPMTYLDYTGLQSFKDQSVSCGEYSQRACGLQGECGASQNSYQELLTIIGPGGGGTGTDAAPQVLITSPSDGAVVPPGFTVSANATDDGTVSRVELYVDGTLVDTKTSGPFSFVTSGSMAEGDHTIETVAYDDSNQQNSAQIAVTVQNGAPDPTGGGGGGGGGNGQDPGDLVGGCSAGGSGGGFLFLALALGGLVIRRRR